MEKEKIQWWIVGLFALIGSILYSNTFNVPFHFDDDNNIKNPTLRIESFSCEEIKTAFSSGTLSTRPVSNVSFALNYYLGGYRVPGYHLVNLLVHIGAGLSLYLFFRVTLEVEVNKQQYQNGNLISLLAALLWFSHPLATQSVTYIVQRMNSLAALFFILAMLSYALGRYRQRATAGNGQSGFYGWGWFVACGVAGLLAVGSKEIAATLPFFIFLYEWYFFQDAKWEWIGKKLLWLGGVLIVFLVIATFYTDGHFIDRIFSNNCSGRNFTSIERVMTQFRVVMYYLTLIFYPHPGRMALDYDFPISTSLLSPISTLYSLLGILALFGLALLLLRRERLLSFCLLWFFGNLVIESSVICLEIIFEHRTYLPSMFLLLSVVALVVRFMRGHLLSAVFLIFVIFLCGYWTYQRNFSWQTSRALWADSVQKHPGKSRPHVNLGLALIEADEVEAAEREFRTGLSLDPKAEKGHYNLAVLLQRQGKMEEAEQHYREVVGIDPDNVMARVMLGEILRDRGQYLEAEQHFRQALRVAPDDAVVNKNLGNALLRGGNPQEALPFLRKAAQGASKDMEILLDVGEAQTLLGQLDEAVKTYQKILGKDRSQGSAHYHLAMLFKKKGVGREALFHYKEADRLLHYPVDLKYDYANLLFMAGQLAEANAKYDEFLAGDISLAKAHNNKGLVLVNQGKFEEAVQQFATALQLDPAFDLAAMNLRLAREQLQQATGRGASGDLPVQPKSEGGK